ncbi:hypothetical protein ROZALSC1DRAFT_27799 [Rozella allomycis CSF55]|uniref:Uncharacterized protein n=1 Tax=Rozella allomycis (strain CSF55) TaxID=988480 RepID=A0A075AQJ1_ROZAC|nr:hypothetical protein O9G_002292 [Rozella allomycis CSF55]RKP20748.1 hypothetical protein ROZALSC1DRAFT_27799 [Rozella allomycis CSF55]|eukprot:EPZ32516.1 hypothetical protein O9G_002292 [Rozella allomycis CSF55]
MPSQDHHDNVDSSSYTISHLMEEIGKRLSLRSERDDLVDDKKISSSIVQAKLSLEKEKEKEKLNGRIQRRPSKAELEERNILIQDTTSTDPLTIRRKSFEFRQTQLKSCLRKRMDKNELQERNILKGIDYHLLKIDTKTDPALASASAKLIRAQLENSLENKMQHRPTPESIAKILGFKDVVEVLPTYRADDYNRKVDDNVTFKMLTPKLKQEIREELNQYKREEMIVHEESVANTAFH